MLAGASKQWTQKSRKPFTYRLLQLLQLIMADFDGRQKSRPQAGFLMPADYVPRLKHQRFFADFSASLSCSMLTVRCLGSCLIAFCSADQN